MKDKTPQTSILLKPLVSGARPATPFLLVGGLLVIMGAGTGFALFQVGDGQGLGGRKVEVAPGAKVAGSEVGFEDEETFRDKAEGQLEKGGIDGEGTHHLERAGGPSQFVYLTSSVIDLDDFEGQKVRVWGETHKGQKAGWLMDVGRVKVIE